MSEVGLISAEIKKNPKESVWIMVCQAYNQNKVNKILRKKQTTNYSQLNRESRATPTTIKRGGVNLFFNLFFLYVHVIQFRTIKL